MEEENKKAVQAKREVAADSLQKFKLEILDIKNSSSIAGELGPLQYLSGLTGTPMDQIINILLLIIIFVFDPLAISLVVAANFAFAQANRKNLYNEFEDEVSEQDIWDTLEEDDLPDEARGFEPPEEPVTDPLKDYDEEDAKRMDIIGQNGNEGEHYEEELIVVESKDGPPEPVKILHRGPSQHRVLFSDGSEKKVPKDDNIIRYL